MENLVREYMQVEAEYNHWKEKREFLTKRRPEIPITFDSLEEAKRFKVMVDDYEDELKVVKDKMHECLLQQATLGKEILNLLPIRNVWVRAGDYAVGFYYDVWGGGHYELSVKPWNDNLPKLVDHTYYA